MFIAMRVRIATLCCAFAAVPISVQAADAAADAGSNAKPEAVTPSPITDRFAASGSYFRSSVSTDARIDDTAGGTAGTLFSAEQDFGLAEQVRQGRADFMFRLKDRGKLRVAAMRLDRKASVILARSVEYGDQTFQINDRVNSEFDWDTIDLTWTYSFIRNDRIELGAGMGLHLIQTQVSAVVPARSAREEFDGAGPFATLAVDGTWRITRRFALSARAQQLKLTINDITGSLLDYHADLQFRWRPNLAVGIGYQGNRVELDAPLEDPGGSLRFDVRGPVLFLRVSF